MNQKFSVEYFNKELNAFRELLGQKTFWDKTDEEKDGAIKGLTFVYFNTECKTPKEEDQIQASFTAAIESYNSRSVYMFSLMLKKVIA